MELFKTISERVIRMKSKKWIALGLTALGIGGLLLVSYPAMTSASVIPAAKSTRFGAALCGWSGSMIDSISKLLGMDQTEIIKERQAGKSMVEIAKTKGVDEEKLVNTIVEERKAVLDQIVKDGLITKEQAQYCNDNMEQRIDANLNTTAVGPANGRGMRGGRGPGAGAGFGAGCGGAGAGCGLANGQGYCQGYGVVQQQQ